MSKNATTRIAAAKRHFPLPGEAPQWHWKSVVFLVESLRRLFLDLDPILPRLDFSREELDLIWTTELWPAYEDTVGDRPSRLEIARAWATYRNS